MLQYDRIRHPSKQNHCMSPNITSPNQNSLNPFFCLSEKGMVSVMVCSLAREKHSLTRYHHSSHKDNTQAANDPYEERDAANFSRQTFSPASFCTLSSVNIFIDKSENVMNLVNENTMQSN